MFEEVLSVQCPTSRLRIKIKGAGIAPAIKVSSNLYLQFLTLASHFEGFSAVCCFLFCLSIALLLKQLLCVALDMFVHHSSFFLGCNATA